MREVELPGGVQHRSSGLEVAVPHVAGVGGGGVGHVAVAGQGAGGTLKHLLPFPKYKSTLIDK